jgi:hypothetical protein
MKIIRDTNQTQVTKGKLTVGSVTFFSIELAWRDNKRGVSCIPIGIYSWRKRARTNNIPYEHVLIEGVPGRSGICIHAANYAAGAKVQLKGCIAVGSGYLDLDGDGIDDIINSKATFNKLMAMLPQNGIIEIE